jgi:hypothetical protein
VLSEIAPGLKRAAIMFDTDTADALAYMLSFETAAGSLKVLLITAPVHSDVVIEAAFRSLVATDRKQVVAINRNDWSPSVGESVGPFLCTVRTICGYDRRDKLLLKSVIHLGRSIGRSQ